MSSSFKRNSRTFLLLLASLATAAPLAGCNNSTTNSGNKTSNVALYTLSFYSDGGSQVADILFHEGDTVKEPDHPTKTGYVFQGWYSDYKHTSAFSFLNPMPANNLVLYAYWKVASSATPEQIQAYMTNLAATSEKDHLYVHYLRYENTAESYNDWDIWCWPYKPEGGRGL
jgi:uncharacterized repeat protein (TIGR02543 family)